MTENTESHREPVSLALPPCSSRGGGHGAIQHEGVVVQAYTADICGGGVITRVDNISGSTHRWRTC